MIELLTWFCVENKEKNKMNLLVPKKRERKKNINNNSQNKSQKKKVEN